MLRGSRSSCPAFSHKFIYHRPRGKKLVFYFGSCTERRVYNILFLPFSGKKKKCMAGKTWFHVTSKNDNTEIDIYGYLIPSLRTRIESFSIDDARKYLRTEYACIKNAF